MSKPSTPKIPKSPFAVHPVMLNDQELATYGPSFYEHVARERASWMHVHPIKEEPLNTLDSVINYAYNAYGYSWFMPTFTFFFADRGAMCFTVPGDLELYLPVISRMINRLNPICIVTAFPYDTLITAVGQHPEDRLFQLYGVPFELGKVPDHIIDAFLDVYSIPLPPVRIVPEVDRFIDKILAANQAPGPGNSKVKWMGLHQ